MVTESCQSSVQTDSLGLSGPLGANALHSPSLNTWPHPVAVLALRHTIFDCTKTYGLTLSNSGFLSAVKFSEYCQRISYECALLCLSSQEVHCQPRLMLQRLFFILLYGAGDKDSPREVQLDIEELGSDLSCTDHWCDDSEH